MNVTFEQPDKLNGILKIELLSADYQPQVEEVLKKYQRTAQLQGFRPGKVPAGIIKKMYYKGAMLDELNKLTSSTLGNYIYENKLDVIGQPIPKKSEKEMVFEEGASFEFLYELGMAPQFEVNLSAKDKLPFYIVKVDDKMVDDEMNDLRRRYGKFSNPETSEATNILYGSFEELDETGAVKEGGNVTTTTLSIEIIKDAIDRSQFIGLKKDKSVVFNPMKVFCNETEVSTMLKVEKNSPSVNADYRFTIKTINQVDRADLTQEFFDKIHGVDIVKSVEEFRAKIREGIASHFERESDKKLRKDLNKHLLERLEIPLPDDFLKRMLKANMDEKESKMTEEEFEHQYFHVAEELRWDLIKKRVAEANTLVVEADEILNLAAVMVRQQFAQYGMYDIDDVRMKEITDDYVKKEENADRLQKSIMEDKVFRHLKQQVKLEVEELPYEEFVSKLNEKTQHELEHHH